MECGAFNRLVNAKHGKMLVNRHDIYIGRSILELGEFSEGEVDLFRQVVRVGGFVLEAGANIGAHTVPLAKMVGPTGRVIAIEPQRVVFQTLCANLALNSITNVYAYCAAVGKQVGKLLVPEIDYTQDNNFGGLGLEGRTSGQDVPLLTIDSLGLERLDLLKADVEGMELDVLLGAEQTIARCHPLLYVENDRQEKSEELIAHIKSLDYAAYVHKPRLFVENNFFGKPENPFGNIISLNIFAVHKSVQANITGLPQL